jgi:Tol biopolymer transport system component
MPRYSRRAARQIIHIPRVALSLAVVLLALMVPVTFGAVLAPPAAAQTALPAEEKILFTSNGDIWSMNPDGSQETNLTNTRSFVESVPVMSPTDSKIAFVGTASGAEAHDYYVVGSDGKGRVKLTDVAASCLCDLGAPTWSPDGTRIAYVNDRVIYAMDADGSGQTNLTGASESVADPHDPDWSPDGTKIAFASLGDIFTTNADGTGQVDNLTNTSEWDDPREIEPAWSPDGTKIAYRNESVDELFVMNADGSGEHAGLSNARSSDKAQPAWSPDGARIAYHGYDAGHKIFAIAADGSGEQFNLTDAAAGTTIDMSGMNPDWGMLVTALDTTITAKPDSSTTDTSASFSFSSTRPGSTFNCSLDGAPFAVCTSPQRYPEGLTEGSHTFKVQATDAAGNTDPTPATFTWKVDTTAPTVTITGGDSGFVSWDDTSFFFTSSEADATFECMFDTDDAANFAPCSPWHDYMNASEGPHVFRVRATDPAGNKSAIVSRSWTVDTVNPTGSIAINGGATTTRSRTVTLRLSADDAAPSSGLNGMRLGNCASGPGCFTAWQPYATSKSWTLSKGAGTKTVYVHYRDRAGNLILLKDTIKYRP